MSGSEETGKGSQVKPFGLLSAMTVLFGSLIKMAKYSEDMAMTGSLSLVLASKFMLPMLIPSPALMLLETFISMKVDIGT